MKPTNTNGIITQAAQNQSAPSRKASSPANMMRSVLDNEATKKLLQDSLKENAGAFSASVLDLYNSDAYLQKCDPAKVFGECLKAVSLKLPISKQLGFAYVVPYGNVPQFQLGYKGMIQLCMRTGEYKHINADVVYEGEYQGTNKLTGEVDLTGDKVSDKIIGYFAYIETINGFKKTLYWSREKVTAHAKRFSKSFSSKNSVWVENFDAMALKTVMRNLISKYGIMSIEMCNALSVEQSDTPISDYPSTDYTSEQPTEIDAEISEVQPESSEQATHPETDVPSDVYPFSE